MFLKEVSTTLSKSLSSTLSKLVETRVRNLPIADKFAREIHALGVRSTLLMGGFQPRPPYADGESPVAQSVLTIVLLKTWSDQKL